MYDEIKAKLDEEIMDQLSVLSDMDVGSDKRKTAVDDLVKLYRLRIEETKNDRDFIEGVNAREREEQFKKERNRSIIPRTGKEKSLENGARKV